MSFREILSAELRDDPLDVGYGAMTDQETADSLNAKTRTRVVPRALLLQEFIGNPAITQQSKVAVFRHPRFPEFKQAFDRQDHADVVNYGRMFLLDGTIQQAEFEGFRAYCEQQSSVSVSRFEELGLDRLGFGQATAAMIAEVR
jgi:hypothetical protein